MKMRLKPPPGHKLIRDWEGKQVKTIRELRNASLVIPVGTFANVVRARGGTGLHIESQPCECCGVQIRITEVSHTDVELTAHGLKPCAVDL